MLEETLQLQLFPPVLRSFAKISTSFASNIKKEMDRSTWEVGKLLLKHSRDLSMMVPYCSDFSNLTKLWTGAKKENASFAGFVQTTLEKSGSKERDVISLLIAPVQRIPRLLLFW